ncbi:hypothetical protein Acsp01_80140 [Actinoplanes sp. NBRC 101535]|nr:hypothetical protein Acsp01_80140 [Actinoplanes sp. NBRC 101535]
MVNDSRNEFAGSAESDANQALTSDQVDVDISDAIELEENLYEDQEKRSQDYSHSLEPHGVPDEKRAAQFTNEDPSPAESVGEEPALSDFSLDGMANTDTELKPADSSRTPEPSSVHLNENEVARRTTSWFDPPDLEAIRESVKAATVDIDVEDNAGTVIGIQITAQFGRMLEPQPLTDETLMTISQVFQKPVLLKEGIKRDFDDVAESFFAPGSIVVISGRSGSGRTITALAMLALLRKRAGVNVLTVGYGASSKFDLTRFPQASRSGFLLELPTDDAEFMVGSDFGVTLRETQALLQQLYSHLVVVTSDEQWRRIGIGSPVQPIAVESLPKRKMAYSWIELDAPEVAAEDWVKGPEIGEILDAEKTPRGVMEIVTLILSAGLALPERLPELEQREIDRVPTGPRREKDLDSRRRIASVIAARASWRPQLLEWHKQPTRTSFERNFLLAAATLPDTPVSEVHIAARTLTRKLGEEPPGLGQQGPGVIHLADLVEAELVGKDDILEFPRPGWENAVLQYFWIDRPDSRQKFLSWLSSAPIEIPKEALAIGTPTSAADGRKRAQRMASFVLRWASRQKRPEYLSGIVMAWHGQDNLWLAAVEALNRACFDDTIGRDTHALLLNWSGQQNSVLREAVAEVCSGEFGRAYPGKALVRLSHIGESEDKDVIKAARKALKTLWEDHSLRGTVLTEVLKWCSADKETKRAAGRRAFTTLADIPYEHEPAWPDLLILDEQASDEDLRHRLSQVATGWYFILDSPNVSVEAVDVSARWFDAALLFPNARKSLIEVFQQAVSKLSSAGFPLHHSLIDLAYIWNPGDGKEKLRDDVRHDLTDALTPHGLAIFKSVYEEKRD